MKFPLGKLACDSLGFSAVFAVSLLPLWVFWWIQWQSTVDVIASNLLRVFGVYIVFLVAYASWKLKKELPRILVYTVLPTVFIAFSGCVLAETLLTQNLHLVFSGLDKGLRFGVTLLSTFTWGIFACFTLLLAKREKLAPSDGLAFTAIGFLFLSNVWQLPVESDILFYNWSWYFAGLAFTYLLFRLRWKPTKLFMANAAVCLATFALWSYLPVAFLRVPFAFLPLTMLQEIRN